MKQSNKLVKHNLVRGLKDVTFEKHKLCSACQAGKQVGNTHPLKSIMSTSKAFGGKMDMAIMMATLGVGRNPT
jgi:hypothetical protein